MSTPHKQNSKLGLYAPVSTLRRIIGTEKPLTIEVNEMGWCISTPHLRFPGNIS